MSRKTSESGEDLCPVCSENIKIYAIGKCDHIVCYRCSTRMRVLCEQMYCAICRTDLPKVAFVKSISKFENIDTSSFLVSRKQKTYFENEQFQDAFLELLEHRCTKCPGQKSFRTFAVLRDHMRKDHSCFYCDLCVKHLKVFTHERKYYDRQNLARHRRMGDPDDKSHKGHPLCEFCDERFLDADELVRHLRKEHYFCHFCETDGINNQFYSEYCFLRDHFRTDHYLCEEGDCMDIQFTNAFRSDIDLRAHLATEHTKSMSRAQARQARTLEIDINYGSRYQGGGVKRGGRGRGRGHHTVISGADYEETNPDSRRRDYSQRERRQRNREEQEMFDAAVALGASHQQQGNISVVEKSVSRQSNDVSVSMPSGSTKPKGGAVMDDVYKERSADFPMLDGRLMNHAESDEDVLQDVKREPGQRVPDTLAKKVARANNMSTNDGPLDAEEFPSLGGGNKAVGPLASVWSKGDFPALSQRSRTPSAQPRHTEKQPAKPVVKQQSKPHPGNLTDFPSLSNISSTLISSDRRKVLSQNLMSTSATSQSKAAVSSSAGNLKKYPAQHVFDSEPSPRSAVKSNSTSSQSKTTVSSSVGNQKKYSAQPVFDSEPSPRPAVKINSVAPVPKSIKVAMAEGAPAPRHTQSNIKVVSSNLNTPSSQGSKVEISNVKPPNLSEDFPTLGGSTDVTSHLRFEWGPKSRPEVPPDTNTEEQFVTIKLKNKNKKKSKKPAKVEESLIPLAALCLSDSEEEKDLDGSDNEKLDTEKQNNKMQLQSSKSKKKKTESKNYSTDKASIETTLEKTVKEKENSKTSNKGKKTTSGVLSEGILNDTEEEQESKALVKDEVQKSNKSKKRKQEQKIISAEELNSENLLEKQLKEKENLKTNKKERGKKKDNIKIKEEIKNGSSNMSSSTSCPEVKLIAEEESDVTKLKTNDIVSADKLVLDDFPSLYALRDQSNLQINKFDESDFPLLGLELPKASPHVLPPGFKSNNGNLPTAPPPGFSNSLSKTKKSLCAPPGFIEPTESQDLTSATFPCGKEDQVASVPNTNSGKTYEYIQPSDFQVRNQKLLGAIQDLTKANEDGFHRFKLCSGQFRQGQLSGKEYYRECIDIIGTENFQEIFPELQALLPDICKQQELLSAHTESKRTKPNKKGRKPAWNTVDVEFKTCPVCGQVLIEKDAYLHVELHNIDSDFPALQGGRPSVGPGMRAWVRAK